MSHLAPGNPEASAFLTSDSRTVPVTLRLPLLNRPFKISVSIDTS